MKWVNFIYLLHYINTITWYSRREQSLLPKLTYSMTLNESCHHTVILPIKAIGIHDSHKIVSNPSNRNIQFNSIWDIRSKLYPFYLKTIKSYRVGSFGEVNQVTVLCKINVIPSINVIHPALFKISRSINLKRPLCFNLIII